MALDGEEVPCRVDGSEPRERAEDDDGGEARTACVGMHTRSGSYTTKMELVAGSGVKLHRVV